MMPDVCNPPVISSVRFPDGNAKQDFSQTRVGAAGRFKNSFIFKYSPRPGTVAIDRFPDDVPDEVKRPA